MKTRSFLFTSLLAISAVAPAAQAATTAVSNLGESVQAYRDFAFPLAASFTTGPGTSWRLNSATLLFDNFGDPTDSGTVAVGIYDNAGGIPGSDLTGSQTLSIPPTGSTTYTFDFSAATVTLSPSTTYWVVAEQVAGPATDLGWAYTLSDSESTALPGWSIGDTFLQDADEDGTWLSDISNSGMFSVAVDPVPEPSSLLLLGLGGLGLLRRRR